MARLRTHTEFIDIINKMYGYEIYIPLDNYINAATPINILHTVCNNTSLKQPNSLIQGFGCKFCKGGAKYTNNYFLSLVKNLYDDKYTPLETYIDSKTRINFKCNICGNKFTRSPAKFLSGQVCNCLQLKYGLKLHDTFIKEVYNLYKSEYIVLSKYIEAYSKIHIQHNIDKCKHKFWTTPHNFLRGRRCPKCYGTKKKPHNQFVDEVNRLYGADYTIIGKYINNSTPLLVRHNICGKEYEAKPTNLLNDKQCSCKRRSKGEELIASILNLNNIIYKSEATIEGCKKKRLLRFDFLIYYNKTKFFIIEYDGTPHRENAFGNDTSYKELKENDKIKNKFCYDNNIPIYRINTLDEINKKLTEIFNEYFPDLVFRF